MPQRNILLIIADDYGIDATRYYPKADRRVTNPPAPATPILSQLAADGLLFRNARAQPSCSPTRATIMTGRYGFRTGIGKPVPKDVNATVPVFSPAEFTLPEAFAQAFAARPAEAYRTSLVGKWHLSRGINDPRLHGWHVRLGPGSEPGAISRLFSLAQGREWRPNHEVTAYATTDQVDDALAEIGRATDESPLPDLAGLERTTFDLSTAAAQSDHL